jgi:sugar phosphate isomerase/epimerase
VVIAIADEGVDVAAGGRFPGPVGHLDRDVHDHLVVAERDRDLGRYLGGQVHRVLGGDQHDPARAEAVDLMAEAGGRLAGTEADALGQGVVDEAHAPIFRYRPAVGAGGAGTDRGAAAPPRR